MTFEIALVLGILVISLILFISEVIRMDVVALPGVRRFQQ